MNTIIIIPALNPDEKLISYVIQAGEKQILIIDDGSSDDCRFIFDFLEEKEECIVLRHAINMGKGRALKDAFNYCLTNLSQTASGVITVDSDGQHSVEDVLRMKEALTEYTDSLILGARNFSQENVPPKSAFGNKMTRVVIRLLYGGNIADTQTGLRAMSYQVLPAFLTLFGERFEYETGMLIEALQKKIPIKEIEIKTIYYAENKGTHFRPVSDSWKIYKLIFGTFFKYAFSSFSSSIIDLGSFQLFSYLLKGTNLSVQVWMATILARIISSLYNYCVNRNIVFKQDCKGNNTFLKYYILCVCQMCTSAALVYLFVRVIGLPRLFIKVIVDMLLFFVSFRIQKNGCSEEINDVVYKNTHSTCCIYGVHSVA